MKQYLTLLILFLAFGNVVLGQGWIRTYPDIGLNGVKDIKQTADGGYIIGGAKITWSFNSFYTEQPFLMKLDPNGDTSWTKVYFNNGSAITSVLQTQSGGYIATVENGHVLKVLSNGEQDISWTQNYNNSVVKETNNGGYILSGSTNGTTFDILLMETDNQGDTLWIETYGDSTARNIRTDIRPTSDGGYIITSLKQNWVSNQWDKGLINLIKTDSIGQLQWSKLYGDTATYQYPRQVHQTNDGGYIIANQVSSPNGTPSSFRTYLIKTDASGDTIWTKLYGSATHPESCQSMHPTYDGGYILAVDKDKGLFSSTNNVAIVKIDALGTILWEQRYGYSDYYSDPVIQITTDGGYILGALNYTNSSNFYHNIYFVRTDSLGVLYSGTLEGQIFQDNNNNCLYDNSIDYPLSGLIVTAESPTGLVLYATTDSLGHYTTNIDTGTHQINLANYSPYYSFNCQSNIDTLVYDSFYQSKVLDFSLTPLISCPLLQVDISAPFIRPTGSGSHYTISYTNIGTSDATNAYVELTLDTALNILNTSIPIQNQIGNIYTFNIGNIGTNQSGSFSIQVRGNPGIQAGQMVCSKVNIFPDSICIPNYWNGPQLSAFAQCQNDTIFFEVRNKGAAMSVGTDYYVYEDNIMLRTGTTLPLGTNGTEQIIQPAALGKTYRFEVEQVTGFPTLLGDSIASVNIANCNPINSPNNNNFITQFSNGSSSPFEAIDCQPSIASYDPNDKSAQPVGYGNNHFIYDYIALDYKIRFQNTGTDTAFRVVIRDTLSPYLNPASIQMGASSHSYTWRVYGSNILEVTFDNILLPDSSTNELASNGFFRFRIEQQADNPLGSVIYNSAAIYFDYNPPIITNETFHTIGDNFVVIQLLGIDEIVTNDPINIQVYPNPFKEQTTIQIEGQEYHHLKLMIYDLTGKLIQLQQGVGNQFILKRNQLQQGLYIYQLEGDGKLLNSGKLIAQ